MIKNLLFGAVVPLVFVAVGVGVLIGLKRPEPKRKKPLGDSTAELLEILPVADIETVLALSELSDTLDITVNGTVVPYRELQLAAEVAGKIIEKNPLARSGNYVRQGQVLYRIDPRDYELELERLRRKRDQELASLAELDQDIANSERLVAVVDEELQLAEIDVKRFESLRANISSASELDQARRSRLAAMNQKINVQNQIRTNQARRSRLELAIQLAETEIEKAALDLERTVIVAPVDGRIVMESVEADSFVQRGTQLVVIEDTEKVEVACNVRMDQLYWILDRSAVSADELTSAAQASRFQLPPTPVKLQFRAGGRENTVFQWDGVLDRYEGAGLDAQSRTVPLRVRVDNPSQFTVLGEKKTNQQASSGPPMLVRGMFVDAIIQAKPATQLLLVPKLSIKPATNSYQIWKFISDPQAIYASRQAIRARQLAEQSNNSQQESDASADLEDSSAADESQTKVPFDPDRWEAGFLHVLDDVQVVGAFVPPPGMTLRADVDYSVCEVSGQRLSPTDRVVVSPLPGIEGNNRDPIRVEKP